jgi:catechol 2,3-dioxygenase-like lactoylglutathione lyase family enzyme
MRYDSGASLVMRSNYLRRIPMIRKLSHTTIYVLDQEQALDFYTNKLGFEVRADMKMGDFRWLTVAPKTQPELELVLFAVTPGNMLDAAAAEHLRALLDKGALGGGVFETADCHATYAELKARGVEFASPPQEQPYGIEATFRDNSGNMFSLTQHR